MSQRKHGHEQFRNLFKSPSKDKNGTPSPEQSSRPRASRKSPFKNAKGAEASSRSSKSTKSKKKSGQRHRPSFMNWFHRKSPSNNPPSPNSKEQLDPSNQRAPKSPAQVKTPTTPQTPPSAPSSRRRTPKKKPSTGPGSSPDHATPQKWNGQDVQEKTKMCMTVFENDAGATANGGNIQLAEAKIKERKLQWKKEEPAPSSDPTSRQQEPTSGSATTGTGTGSADLVTAIAQPGAGAGAGKKTDVASTEKKKGSKEELKGSKEELIPEANKTLQDRTEFENDENPATVKEEKEKLQWAPGSAEHVSTNEPVVRKKKTTEQRGAVSDRPPRNQPPAVSKSGKPVTPPRSPPRNPVSPIATTPPQSPIPRPMKLHDLPTNQNTVAMSITGSAPRGDPERPVSIYIAPTMQPLSESTKSGGAMDSDPYDDPTSRRKQ